MLLNFVLSALAVMVGFMLSYVWVMLLLRNKKFVKAYMKYVVEVCDEVTQETYVENGLWEQIPETKEVDE